VFVDETQAYLNQSREYGRAARNERVVDDAPKGKKEKVSLLAGVSKAGLIKEGCLIHTGKVDKAAFKTFLLGLVSCVPKGIILVMDNWTVHHGTDIRDIIEGHGCEVLYLPAYSPDFNPIEYLFSKIKAYIKRCRALDTPTLIDTFLAALDTISLQDALNTFTHCGY
jgi:transposase